MFNSCASLMRSHLFIFCFLILTCAATAQTIPFYVPTNGLVGWWPFNGNANDESGNGNDGVAAGQINYVADRFGINSKSVFFQPSSIINTLNIQPANCTFSFSLWLKIPLGYNSGGAAIRLANTPSGFSSQVDKMIQILSPANNIALYVYPGYQIYLTSPTSLSDNQWHHVVASTSPSGMYLFLDGALVASNPNTNCENFAGYWRMELLDGTLDDIGIWNRALTASEVQQLYSAQSLCNLSSNFFPQDTLQACGTSIMLDAINPGSTYSWNTGATTQSINANSSGWYRCTVSQGSACYVTDSVFVSLPNSLPGNLQTGLVGYWPFCGNANDESGNGNNGTLMNGVSLISDRNGISNKAYNFDGVDDYIQIPSNTQFDNLSEITISCWINISLWCTPNINGVEFFPILMQYAHPQLLYGNFGLQLTKSGLNYFYVNSKNYDYNQNNPSFWQNSQWTNIIVTASNGIGTWYINGNSIATVNGINFSNSLNGLPILIGCQSIGPVPGAGSQYANGKIDEIAIWNRSLTPVEVQQLYQIQSPCTLTSNFFSTDTLSGCGNLITLNAGNSGANFSWNTGDTTQSISANSSSWYKCTVSQGSCTATDSVFVSLVTANIVQNDTTVCPGASLTIGLANACIQNTIDTILQPWSEYQYSFAPINDPNWNTTTIGWVTGFSPFGNTNFSDGTSNFNYQTYWPSDGADGNDLYVRKEFDLSNFNISTINWYLGIDNGYELYINGHLISSDNAEGFTYRWEYSGTIPSQYLNPGINVVALALEDHGGLTAFDLMMTGSRNCLNVNWSTGATTPTITVNLSQTTTYYLTVSNGISSCTDSVKVTVNNLNQNIFTQDTVRACGNSYTLDAGNVGSTYSWNTGATTQTISASSTGWYTCMVSQGTCTATDSVFVSIIDSRILQNDTSICLGSHVALNTQVLGVGSSSNANGNSSIGSYSQSISFGWTYNFPVVQGKRYKMVVSGAFSFGTVCPNFEMDPAYWIPPYNGGQPLTHNCNDAWFIQNYCNGSQGLRPTPDTYNPQHSYNYYLTATSNVITVGLYDCCYGDNCGTISFQLFEDNSVTYQWSTGATTASINVTPSQTTTYYVTVSNGISACTDSVTVTVAPGSTAYYADNDNDNYGDSLLGFFCAPPAGGITQGGDCDGMNSAINPGAAEICNGVDDDCNGTADDGLIFLTYFVDTDGDGFGAGTATSSCAPITGSVTNNGDCNDGNPAINPNATEVCNGVDDDCDGVVDDGLTFLTYYTDADGDGYGSTTSTGVSSCNPVAGAVTNNTDCNDDSVAVNPGVTSDGCNGVDNDCDGQTDENASFENYYADGDGDGFGAGAATSSCAPITGSVTNNIDCNDNNAAINPNATEVCNGVDDDCDGVVDDGLTFLTYYTDEDGDGYGSTTSTGVSSCNPVAGAVTNNTDCNDASVAVNPGVTSDACNGVDNDCDGQTDEDASFQNYYADGDGDGFGAGAATSSCAPITGSVTNNIDCNDNNAYINPTATEQCNATDDDCDTQVDEGLLFSTWYADADGDNYGAGAGVVACIAPPLHVLSAGDCDDTNAAINPGASESCNSTDDNCNGTIDEGITPQYTYYADLDGDTYGNAASPVSSCYSSAPSGTVTNALDCTDNDATINPAASEVCGDLLDNNCDGAIDEGCTCTNPSTALAGVNFAICSGQTANLTGAIGGSASSALWTSTGTGSFGNATNPITTYTPSAADRSAGSVVLTLTSNDPDGVGPCVEGVSSITLTINPLPAASGAISGPASLCYPQTPVTYSVAPTAGATSYAWTVPAGTTIVSGQGTNAITVSWPFSTMHAGLLGDICVTPQNSNSCGSSTSSCLKISVQVSVPVAPSSVSGVGRACPNDVAIYSVAPVTRAEYYIWTLPAGASIIGSSNTNIISVKFSPSFAGGSISVQAASACGIGPARSRTIGTNLLTAPASINGPINGVCSASGVVYSATPVTGAISYLWTVPAGATIVGPSTGFSIAVDFSSSFSSGSVTCRAVNNCGPGSTRSVSVKGSPATPNAISGPLTVCPSGSYAYSVGAITGATSYVWTTPAGAIITGGIDTKYITLQFGSYLSSGLSIGVRASNACGTSSISTLSGIAVVACPRVGENSSVMSLTAFPNPTKEVLNITFSSDLVANANLRLVDLTGRVVYNEAREVVEGFNSTAMVVKGLASGVYTLQLQMKDRSEQLRIIVD
jgi:hypothetical protein